MQVYRYFLTSPTGMPAKKPTEKRTMTLLTGATIRQTAKCQDRLELLDYWNHTNVNIVFRDSHQLVQYNVLFKYEVKF